MIVSHGTEVAVKCNHTSAIEIRVPITIWTMAAEAINVTNRGSLRRLVIMYCRYDHIEIIPGEDESLRAIPYCIGVGKLGDFPVESLIHIRAVLYAISSIPRPECQRNYHEDHTVQKMDYS